MAVTRSAIRMVRTRSRMLNAMSGYALWRRRCADREMVRLLCMGTSVRCSLYRSWPVWRRGDAIFRWIRICRRNALRKFWPRQERSWYWRMRRWMCLVWHVFLRKRWCRRIRKRRLFIRRKMSARTLFSRAVRRERARVCRSPMKICRTLSRGSRRRRSWRLFTARGC